MAFPLIPVIAGGLQAAGLISQIVGQNKQQKENMKLAQFQATANEKYLQQYLDWNTPKNQMARYQDAGLNPNLIYGQGTPGNQSAPLSFPDIKPTDYQSLMQAVPAMNQTLLTQAQVQATNAKTRQTTVLTELNKLQARVLQKNPLLNDEGYKATIDSLKASAELKASQAGQESMQLKWMGQESFFKNSQGEMEVTYKGYEKLDREMQLLEQKFNLGNLDAKLKAQVMTSKEFQNAILEVEKRFMTDFEVTPKHILQFVQLLLMKSL